METKASLSDEQIDFLREMINIGACHAATAFSQILHCVVDVKIPEIYFFPASQAPPFLKDPALPFAGAYMKMVGDVRGSLFFLVPDKDKEGLVELAKKAVPWIEHEELIAVDLSALEEIGNILAGVFLVAIHDFCRLNIYHTVPELKIDMIQSLIDESIAGAIGDSPKMLLIESEFTITGRNFRTFFLIIPDVESTKILASSIDKAREEFMQ